MGKVCSALNRRAVLFVIGHLTLAALNFLVHGDALRCQLWIAAEKVIVSAIAGVHLRTDLHFVSFRW